MTEKEKLEKIKEILSEVYKNKENELPISAWDGYYMDFISALNSISNIINN